MVVYHGLELLFDREDCSGLRNYFIVLSFQDNPVYNIFTKEIGIGIMMGIERIKRIETIERIGIEGKVKESTSRSPWKGYLSCLFVGV